MNEVHGFQVFISSWRLETMLMNVHKTPMEYFEYTVALHPLPPSYHDHFNAVLPMLLHYFCFTNATTQVSRPRPQYSCCKTANRVPRNTTTIFNWYSYAGKLVTYQQQFAQLHYVDLKHRGYRDVGVSARTASANVMLQTYNVSFSGIRTTDIDFFRCDFMVAYRNDGLWQHVRQS